MFEVSSSRNRRTIRPRQAAGTALLASLALAGCSRTPIDAGVDLYHDLEGGAIAEQRPPPPGLDAPYPNLGSIPARPTAPDVAAQQRIADQLATQRDAATLAAANSPLTVLPATPAPPKPATAPDPNANRVVVDAAATPPAQAAVVAPAIGLAAVPAVPNAVVSGPVPTLAAAPPPPPPAAGFGLVQPVLTPSPVRAPVLPTAPEGTVAIAFTPGSATLPPSAPLILRRFALAHRGVPVTILGRGEAVLAGADAQGRALDLALRRAQAIATALADAGVSAANLRLRAQAAGQGGSASL